MSDELPDQRLRRDPLGGIYAVGVVDGHRLLGHAQAYLAHDCAQDRCATNIGGTVHQANGASSSVAGWGHGVCECGILSPHVLYGVDRRWWHRHHKARILLGEPEPAGQPAPVDANGVA